MGIRINWEVLSNVIYPSSLSPKILLDLTTPVQALLQDRVRAGSVRVFMYYRYMGARKAFRSTD